MLCICSIVFISGCNDKEKKPQTNVDLGMQSIETAEYDTAIEYFEAAVGEGQQLQLAYRGEGIAYMNKGDYIAAKEKFILALQQAKNAVGDLELDISYYLAAAQFKSGDAASAVTTYTNMLAMDKNNEDLYFLRGVANASLGRHDSAKADFDKTISLKSKNYDRYINIYQAMKENGYEEEGRAYLEMALKEVSEKDSFVRGKLFYYTGDYTSARTELEKAELSGNPEATFYLGKTYEALGDSNYASSLYEKYIETNNTNGEAYNQLGLCRFALEDYEGALNAFQLGIETGDSNMMQSLLFNEIIAYEHLAEFETAKTKMNAYIAIYPDDEQAVRENEFLKTR